MADALYGVPADKIESLVRKMKKASESYSKMDVFDEYDVDWGDRKPLLWELVKQGHYDAWNDPAIWNELNQAAEHAETAHLVDFLTKVEAFDEQPAEDANPEAADDGYDDEYYEDEYYDDGYYDDGYGGYEEPAYESPRLVSFWPVELDRMAMRAYAADAELVESRASEMTEDIQRGLELVRRRFATNGMVDLPEGTVEELAKTSVWSSLPWNIHDIVDGELVEAEIGRDDADGLAARDRFLRKFADEETWGRAVLDAVFLEDYGPNFRGTRPAWPYASVDQLEKMVSMISIYGQDRVTAYEMILSRDDSPAELVQAAANLAEDNRTHQSELLAIAAILKAKQLGEDAPEEAIEYVTFSAIDSATKRSDYVGLSQMIEALKCYDQEQVRARFEAMFTSDYLQLAPFPALHAFADEDLVNRAFGAIDARLERDANISGMKKAVHGLAMLGVDALEDLSARFEEAGENLKLIIRQGITGIIADAEEAPEENYDRFLSMQGFDGETDHQIGHYVLPDYLEALETIGTQRAAAVVAKDLDSEQWNRVIPAVKEVAVPELYDKLFGLLARKGMPASNGYDFANAFYDHEFRTAVEPFVGPALAASDSPDFHNVIKQRFGDEKYEELLASAGGSSAADKGPADRLRRLSEAMFEARDGLERTVVYIFERLDGPPEDGSMNRIGGRPYGIDAWPLRNDDEDEPMTHMFTLDLETVPALRARYKDEVRAISLFLRNPNHNSAWSPGNDETLVHHVMTDDLSEYQGELLAGDEEAVGFAVHEVEVPLEAWTVQYGTDAELEQIRSEVYKQHAWVGGGGPIWLQGDEHFGFPVMQFDEAFIYTNLGDCGIMYVFDDTAFWQCH